MRYDYWVIRYVPDPVRGERVNVGVIAGREHDWAVRRVQNLNRASRLGGSATVTDQFLAQVERAIDANVTEVLSLVSSTPPERMSRGLVEDLRERMQNVIQLSRPRPVLADSAAEAAHVAFQLMVVDDPHETRQQVRTQVRDQLAHAFEREPRLAKHLARRQVATVGQQSTKIDFAVSDGEVLQMSHAWAFDLRDQARLRDQIQAWNFTMGLVRREGGLLAPDVGSSGNGRQRLEIPNDVPVKVLYRAPSTSAGLDQLRVARDGWGHLDVESVEESEVSSVVSEALSLVA